MDAQGEFAGFLSRLLGRTVGIDDVVTLSSAQQARAAGWLAERGFATVDLRPLLGRRFAPCELSSAEASEQRKAPPAITSPATHATSASLQVGIDIQHVDELLPKGLDGDPKRSAELAAMFTMREISYAQTQAFVRETLCGLFCAKEALRKCDGRLLGARLTDIEILPDENGKPRYPGFSLSISHSGGFAVAVAVASAF